MADYEKESQEVHPHHPGGDDKGGIYALLVVIVILLLAAVLWFSGVFGGGAQEEENGLDFEADVRIEERTETPDVEVPAPEDEEAPNP